MNKNEIVDAYKGLQKVEQAFKNMKTVLLELRPIYHKSDDRIISHVFIVMLAYYLQWHVMQKVKPLFDNDGVGVDRLWSFDIIIKRLKTIMRVENLINGIVINKSITTPDQEQKKILELIEVKI